MLRFKSLACVALLIIVFAVGCSAYNAGAGTKDDPYEIDSFTVFKEFAMDSTLSSLEDVYFVQVEDITINTNITVGAVETIPFMGHYDGNGHKITVTTNIPAVFTYVENATVSNLEVVNEYVAVSNLSGGIVGKATGNTVITNCSFTGKILSVAKNINNSYFGGIAGSTASGTKIINCTSSINANLNSAPLFAHWGLIAGKNNGEIIGCTATGTVSCVSGDIELALGGIAGENNGVIKGCKNAASLSGTINTYMSQLYVGGIVGKNKGSVSDSNNIGALSANGYNTSYPAYVGGIVGYNNNGSVSVSKNSGSIEASISYIGGIAGINYSDNGESTVADTLNTGNVIGSDSVAGGLVGGNIAVEDSANISSITSSMNLNSTTYGDAVLGVSETTENGVSDVNNVIVRNASGNAYAVSMTDKELATADSITQLQSDAWLYPKNGLLPQLATLKGLEKTELLALTLDKVASKAAFSVYSKTAVKNAVATVSFYNGQKMIGVKLVEINVNAGYSVHSVTSAYAASADKVSVMLFENDSLSPKTDKVDFD